MRIHDNRFLGDAIKNVFSEGVAKDAIGLIVCNCAEVPFRVLEGLWPKAALRVCADGGTNRLYDYYKSDESNRRLKSFVPDFIVGDLDSVRKDVLDFYEKNESVRVFKPSQDCHDLDKAVKFARDYWKERVAGNDSVKLRLVILGAFGERLDQGIANLNMLYRWREEPFFSRIILMCKYNMAFLLNQGEHKIRCDERLESKVCGLVPLGEPATNVTTSGLRWNLQNTAMQFGELISTSNEIQRECVEGINRFVDVTVDTKTTVLWTTVLTEL